MPEILNQMTKAATTPKTKGHHKKTRLTNYEIFGYVEMFTKHAT